MRKGDGVETAETARAPGDESSAARPDVDDNEILSQRIAELEHVIADYAQRYGLTDLARKKMVDTTIEVGR